MVQAWPVAAQRRAREETSKSVANELAQCCSGALTELYLLFDGIRLDGTIPTAFEQNHYTIINTFTYFLNPFHCVSF